MKKKNFVALVASLMLTSNAVVAFASDPTTPDRPFTNFRLYANKVNNYTNPSTPRVKQTYHQYSYVKCTDISGNTDKVTFWIDNYDKQVSYDVHTGISNSFSVIRYLPNINTSKGQKVRLGMENYYYSIESPFVSGLVDYE
ncbi:TPA: DUF2712 domain-containing protein [Clostridium perfringens]|uniref:DUF2712 domain-containing protein n=1 Tax=Clostridium perfringens TaxID=1502 RepID=UPI0024BD0F40|nr:DUF2712 domain-containing protein [Clostridium perfringens]EGT3607294.1 DUF2712 domain-containing protein [Clostridium perfringens]